MCGQARVGSLDVFNAKHDEIVLWHLRLGHTSFQYLKHLFPSLFSNKSVDSFQCEICRLVKHHHAHFPSRPYTPSKPFSLIHSDLLGPSKIPTMTGKKWFVTFIDDHTRVCWVYLLSEKSKAGKTFKVLHSTIKTQCQTNIQVFFFFFFFFLIGKTETILKKAKRPHRIQKVY